MKIDLHTHSTASDGVLEPAELLARAAARGVRLLSVTDHDTTAGYAGLWAPPGLTLVPGIELSSRWTSVPVHVVGLGVDPAARALATAEAAQRALRAARAERIARRLAPLGLSDPLAAARRHAGGGAVGRPHFARALVEAGIASSEQEAFRRFLGRGRRGDVPTTWPSLEQTVGWITTAGGLAVLAHPLHYRLTGARLRRLVRAFVAAGGQALEVVSGSQTPDRTRHLARLCREAGLLASSGSDFHGPAAHGADLGGQPPLPEDLPRVWEHLRVA